MTRFSLGENDSSNMRVGKVTLNNVCGLKAEKEKSWFQGAPLLSQLLRYWNNTSDVQQDRLGPLQKLRFQNLFALALPFNL